MVNTKKAEDPALDIADVKSKKVRARLDQLATQHLRLSRQVAVLAFARLIAADDEDTIAETMGYIADLIQDSTPADIAELAKGVEANKKEVAAEIATLTKEHGLPSKLRSEESGWVAFETRGRETLRKDLLLTRCSGFVDPETGETFGMPVIEECTKRGASYWQVRRAGEKEENEGGAS